jgi:hypothetical protein
MAAVMHPERLEVSVKALSWINVVLGLWLIVAAFTLPVRTGPGMAEEAVAGIVVVVLAYASAVGRPRPGISWSVAIAGLWILVVSYGVVTPSQLNARVVGALVFGLGTANAMYWHLPARTRG